MTHQPFDRHTGNRGWATLLGLLSVLALSADARGQPGQTVPPTPGQPSTDEPDEGEASDEVPDQPSDETSDEHRARGREPDLDATGTSTAPGDSPGDAPSDAASAPDYFAGTGEAAEESAEKSTEEPELEPVPIVLPNIFNAPTGRLLTAGLIYGSATLDTGGGLSGKLRAGLGDVAEFGLEISDLIRARETPDDDAERIWPYVLATFKMGLAEDQLFNQQPAIALGFRKSFSREVDMRKTRAAELYLVATKSFGDRFALHVGGAFWDAELQQNDEDPVLFHSRGWQHQLRPFGGIEIEPLPDAKILVETFWVPEFCYECSPQMKLIPNLAWGVRYDVADGVMIESGVRVPDINEVNLIDAQIFGQLTFVSRTFSRLMKKQKRKQ